MSATPTHDLTTDSTRQAIPNSPRLYLAFELGWNQWKLGFAPGLEPGVSILRKTTKDEFEVFGGRTNGLIPISTRRDPSIDPPLHVR